MAEEKIRMLKGILKNSGTLQPSPEASDAALAEQRAIAIQHAKIIQHRKDLEQQILENIITLSEFPLVTTVEDTAARPASADVSAFRRAIRLFQPTDYDALVEERNVNGRCGYALCPNPRPRPRRGEWALTRTGIAPRKELDKWCSRRCAKRAFYIKAQLSESAAWERAGMPDIEIEIMDEGAASAGRSTGPSEARDPRVEEKLAADLAALSLERGSVTKTGASERQRVKVDIKEKAVRAPKDRVAFADDPMGEDTEDDHLILEGYKPTF